VFLHVDGRDSGRVMLNTHPAGQPQFFCLVKEKKVAAILHGETKKFVCAENFAMRANRDKVGGDWEKFAIEIVASPKIETRAVAVGAEFTCLMPFAASINSRRYDKLVVVANGLPAFCKEASNWELLPNAARTGFFIRNLLTGQFMVVDMGTPEGLTRLVPGITGEHDAFLIEGDWNSTVGLRSCANGKLLCGDKDLRANKEKKAEWESFTIDRS
jgi:hypothetical protein